jgi:hypothetical protein
MRTNDTPCRPHAMVSNSLLKKVFEWSVSNIDSRIKAATHD